jgi:LacI family transcriptional regulator
LLSKTMSQPIKSHLTSAEVARQAGVSRTTVSFVLNGVLNKGISDLTRERVLAVASGLGYEANAAARTLAGGATGTVALVIPKASYLGFDAFLAQLVASINEECHRNGLRLLIESTEDGGREPGAFSQLIKSRRIDGLIVTDLRPSEHDTVRQLLDDGIPMVVWGGIIRDLEHIGLGDDTHDLAVKAVTHLVSLGHRSIAFVNYGQPDYHSVHIRLQGWRDTLAQHNITEDPRWLAFADISAQSGYEATKKMLASGARFTALFAGNDTVAFGALRALQEAGLRVPQDVALMGHDDIPLAVFASPPLTTMRTDPSGVGKRAVGMLLRELKRAGVDTPLHIQNRGELIVRESCGARLAGRA